MPNLATYVRAIPRPAHPDAVVALYRLDPPMRVDKLDPYDLSVEYREQYEYVVVSAVVVPFTGPETLVFLSDENGEIADWAEISGLRGTLKHADALRQAGYEIAPA